MIDNIPSIQYKKVPLLPCLRILAAKNLVQAMEGLGKITMNGRKGMAASEKTGAVVSVVLPKA